MTNLSPGVAGKPKGPLQVSDITAEGCHLAWNPPEDDGGAPIDHYIVERMDTDIGRWVSHPFLYHQKFTEFKGSRSKSKGIGCNFINNTYSYIYIYIY